MGFKLGERGQDMSERANERRETTPNRVFAISASAIQVRLKKSAFSAANAESLLSVVAVRQGRGKRVVLVPARPLPAPPIQKVESNQEGSMQKRVGKRP